MNIYAIRRANVDAYSPGKGASGYDLTETGRYQALLLGNHFAEKGIRFDAIYTGTSSRHEKTAFLIAETLEAICGEKPEVIEFPLIDDVQWTEAALQTCYERNLTQDAWIREWAVGNFEVNDTPTKVRERLQNAKSALVRDNDHETILLVTSAVPLQFLVEDAIKTDVKVTQVHADNTGIFQFEWNKDQTNLNQLNAIPHLTENLLTREYFIGTT